MFFPVGGDGPWHVDVKQLRCFAGDGASAVRHFALQHSWHRWRRLRASDLALSPFRLSLGNLCSLGRGLGLLHLGLPALQRPEGLLLKLLRAGPSSGASSGARAGLRRVLRHRHTYSFVTIDPNQNQ